MYMTLDEVMKTCPDWLAFCALKGVSEWAINEGGGDAQVSLTVEEAAQLGIVTVRS